MTLIDLQGKALYSGDKEVQKAYLGDNVFYQLLSEVSPINHTQSDFALTVQNGEFVNYSTDMSKTYKFVKEGQSIERSSTSVGGLDENSFKLNNQGLVVDFPKGFPNNNYYEVTFEHTDAFKRYNTIFSTNQYGIDVEYAYVDTLRIDNYYGTGIFSSHIDVPRLQNGIHTIQISHSDGYIYIYLDGEIISEGSGSMYKTSVPLTMIVGGSGSTTLRETINPTWTVYDVKFGTNAVTQQQIVANYQNIQDRLQTI